MSLSIQDGKQISPENYAFLQQHIYRLSGIVLDESKRYLLEARLMPIVQRENLRTINDLCALLKATHRSRITEEIAEAMTTNETLFFRDALPFEVFREKLLPVLIEQRKKVRRLRFWSAASSSGQEAYSLAMMMREANLEDWNIEIFGTDLSLKMVEKARSGRYTQTEINRGLSAAQLAKHFDPQGAEWQLKNEVRRMTRFQQFDLRQPLDFNEPFDVILCRNVLIYFDVETKKKILAQIAKTLVPNGYLLLGAAETTLNLSSAFERCLINGVTFYQKR